MLNEARATLWKDTEVKFKSEASYLIFEIFAIFSSVYTASLELDKKVLSNANICRFVSKYHFFFWWVVLESKIRKKS